MSVMGVSSTLALVLQSTSVISVLSKPLLSLFVNVVWACACYLRK